MLYFTFIFQFLVRENLKFGQGESGESQGISDSKISTNLTVGPTVLEMKDIKVHYTIVLQVRGHNGYEIFLKLYEI